MFYINILILLFTAFLDSNNDSSLIDQYYEQLYVYGEQISQNDENLYQWALAEIKYSNCQEFLIAKEKLDLKQDFQLLSKYSCEEINSGNFDKSELWNEENNKRYRYLKSVLIQQRTGQDSVIAKAPHLYLELLMSSSYMDYFSLESISNNLDLWNKKLSKLSSTEDPLKHSIISSIIIWSAYIIDDYVTLYRHIDTFHEASLFPLSNMRLKLYGAFDYTFYTYEEYDKSLKLLENHSLPLAEFLKNEEQAYKIKIRQGVYLYRLGKYHKSKEIYEVLYNLNGIENFYVFTNLGLNYYKLGYSNKYISFQLRALEHDFSDYRNLLNVYRNLFLYYTANKDITSALKYIDKAKEVAITNQDTSELALIDSYLGTFYWSQYSDHEKALKSFDAAQQVLNPKQNYTKYIDLLYEKGDIYIRIDSLNKARQHFEQGMQLALSKSNTVDYVTALINLSAIEMKQNNLSAAEEILSEIGLYSLDDLDFELLTQYFTVRSQYLHLNNRNRAAIDVLQPVVKQVIDRAKNNTDSQEGYWTVENEYLDAIELLVELYEQNDKNTSSLNLLDQLKTINDAALYNSPLVKASKLTEEELAEEKRLNQRLQTLRKRYLNAGESRRFELKQEIDRVSALREQILSKVDLNKSTPLSPIWSIQRAISDDELLLHFTELGSNLYITHLSRDEVNIQKVDFAKKDQDAFNQIADNLASGNTDLMALHSLYQKLNLQHLPNGINEITVIPDNFLYRIPLEVLPTERPDSPISYGSTSYLIEEYSIRYFTSLKEFEHNRRNITSNGETNTDFSGFAISDFSNFSGVNLPSLPYAPIETQNIRTSLSSMDHKVIFNEEEATKETFLNRVGSSRLVHVATHSEVSEQDPLFSTIYLKTGNASDTTLQSDQALYAYELFDTPLNSEFIMLNSCSSGSGNYIQGSGIMGISRALRYAGAKSLALNLWAVNDKIASEFATDFYTQLNNGETKNGAIRQAKLNQLKTGNANPHFWGAYTMIGNPSPVTNNNNSRYLFLVMLTIGTIMTGFLTYSTSTNRQKF
ncbi:MAG: CHAT domain-containing protein [Gracilimonas sp.]|nr:CHAT domain-containing protein [Gracilimonas sp.]